MNSKPLMPTSPAASLLLPTATTATSHDRPPTALMAHMDNHTNNLPMPGHETSTAMWIAETMWQMCHVVTIEFIQVSTFCPSPSSSHTQIQGPHCQQGDVATIQMVQCDNNMTNHDDTTMKQRPPHTSMTHNCPHPMHV